MEKIKRSSHMNIERERLLVAYRQVVSSVREARTMQGVLEKERQIRRLAYHLNRAHVA